VIPAIPVVDRDNAITQEARRRGWFVLPSSYEQRASTALTTRDAVSARCP
jgi:hypothetical protein